MNRIARSTSLTRRHPKPPVGLSHLDGEGRAAMVDVSAKAITRRRATASGRIRLAPATVALVAANRLAKGNVLAVAELAGIQAAKHTFELIPLCHVLVLDKVGVRAALDADGVAVVSEIVCTGRTGAEMEALTAVAVALLTVYDMCKAVDRSMVLEGIRLLDKKKEAV